MIEVLHQDEDGLEVDITCDGDGCNEEILAAEFDNWQAMMKSLKSEGWRTFKSGDTYYHFCRKCK